MGIDEGILVVKQITDEKKWFRAMEEVRGTFRREELFKEYPTEAENAYSVQKRVFDEKDNAKKWEITEPLNFFEQGMDSMGLGYH